VPKDLVTDPKNLKLQSEFSEPSDRMFCDQEDGGPIKDYDHWMKRRCTAAGVTRFGFKGIRTWSPWNSTAPVTLSLKFSAGSGTSRRPPRSATCGPWDWRSGRQTGVSIISGKKTLITHNNTAY